MKEGNIFYAETRGQAKALVTTEFWIPFVDSRVYRVKEADNLPRAKEWGYMIDWSSPVSAKYLRDNWWFEDEDKVCDKCEKGEFGALEQSYLDDNICEECRNGF